VFKERYFTLGEVVENMRNAQESPYPNANNVGFNLSCRPDNHLARMSRDCNKMASTMAMQDGDRTGDDFDRAIPAIWPNPLKSWFWECRVTGHGGFPLPN
jgi:hypothetical protein